MRSATRVCALSKKKKLDSDNRRAQKCALFFMPTHISCRKVYSDLPFAHRQHLHDGHCALIHGHNWTFAFTFDAAIPDQNGFVIDFGKLKWLKDWLHELFDHTMVLNETDPWRPYLEQALTTTRFNDPKAPPFAKIVVIPDASAEGLAQYLLQKVNELLPKCDPTAKERGVRCSHVQAKEDEKNSASATLLYRTS